VDPSPLLEGISVLDLSSVGPAARASRWLADWGAEVVKVAPPSSRTGVQIQPPFFSYGAGRGFKRARVDLKQPAGREAFLRLAARADVLIESFRPGVAERIGIGYQAVRARNPGIVYCSTSGYGQDGPYAGFAGHDLNYLALGGFLESTTPRADGGPPIPGATLADAAAGGLHALAAILAALLQRSHSGQGQHLDVCVAEGVLALMALPIDEYLAVGTRQGPGQSLLTGRYACYDCYRARDGKWLSVAAIEPAFYANLCKALGLERFIPCQTDDARQEEIRAAFRAAFAARDRDAWVAELAPADTCVAPVHSVAELVQDRHLRERRVFVQAEAEGHGRFQQLGPLLAGGLREQPLHRVRPDAETDSEALLRAAGLGAAEIEELRRVGAVE
jgi:alpha-methylacyl-CoA racemase